MGMGKRGQEEEGGGGWGAEGEAQNAKRKPTT